MAECPRQGATLMRTGRYLLAIGLIAAATGAGVAQRGEVPNPPDIYVQRQTGMNFPARVGSAIRHQLVRYNDDGADSGAGYQIPRAGETRNGGMVAYLSIFVYPARAPTVNDAAGREQACAATFEGIRQDIVTRQPNATVRVSEPIRATPAMTAGLAGLVGRRIVYEGGTAPFGGTDQPVRDEARLFCIPGGKWLVSYRITSPIAADADADVARLIDALRWPESFAR